MTYICHSWFFFTFHAQTIIDMWLGTGKRFILYTSYIHTYLLLFFYIYIYYMYIKYTFEYATYVNIIYVYTRRTYFHICKFVILCRKYFWSLLWTNACVYMVCCGLNKKKAQKLAAKMCTCVVYVVYIQNEKCMRCAQTIMHGARRSPPH